jgi:probable F420-dependent oxidoreductase
VNIGISLTFLSPRLWGDVAEEADRLGYESLWIAEHLVVPVTATGSPHAGAEHPPIPSDLPIYDALAYLAFLAARTTNVKLGTHVYNIGLRHPFVTARAATTVDVISNGRLAFGIGASWLREEWEAVGLDFDRRGARVDETIDVCRRLWSEPIVEHHGEFFDFGPTAFEPKPVQPGGPALHIGGDGPAALRRAATVGAGWVPMNHSVDELGPAIARIGEIAQHHGRTTPVEVTVTSVDGIARPEDVERYEKAGVTRVIVRPWSRSSEAIDGIRRFADAVIRPLEEQR